MKHHSNPDVSISVDVDEDEDFTVIIDEPGLTVVRRNGVVAGQANSPVNISDLYFQLAAEGYALSEAISYEDGVIEILLRELGNVADLDNAAEQAKIQIATLRQEKERELAHA